MRDLLERIETEMRYAGWGNPEDDNIGKEMVYQEVCKEIERYERIDNKNREFAQLARPLLNWLNDNKHPHSKIIIECDRAELVEGEVGIGAMGYFRE